MPVIGHSGVRTAKFPVPARVKSLILSERVGTMVLALESERRPEEILILEGGGPMFSTPPPWLA